MVPCATNEQVQVTGIPAAAGSLRAAFHTLARNLWRKRKGRHVWRMLRRPVIAVYRLPGCPLLANTCCTSLLGSGSASRSSIAFPP
jgi:hypothetical protein